ncbi:hypothetical protein [Actinomadura rupiterrae]|uniref:hypothetical protein n=1 Tax=Actinomadura rupiterrae TaxID=559627 RepID=UPI0020A46442|nr:hypothetical protein [Actinomadura rupiterrae]MCP2335172.1 hypothetical protein [Actinomadura rupiterrae]
MKRLVATGLLALTSGGVLLSASPAMANYDDDGPQNNQIIGVQTCRSIDVAVIGAAIHNILGLDNESGDCANGSMVN